MRVVFMGTPEFAVASLEAVAEQHEVLCVYTRPDAASKRGSSLIASPVKACAEELGLPVRQPRTLRDDSEVDALRALSPEVIVVAAYGQILPPEVLSIPPHGAINVHASLLPRWRGAAPIQRAILAGDTTTGISIMRMEEGLDTGPFALQLTVDIADRNATELTDDLARVGARGLTEVLERLPRGDLEWVSQDESLATYAAKIGKDDVRPQPELTPEEILRRVRASGPTAPARVTVGTRTMTLLECIVATERVAQGLASCAPGGIVLGAQGGAVLATVVKPDGRAAMRGDACARGMTFDAHTRWQGA